MASERDSKDSAPAAHEPATDAGGLGGSGDQEQRAATLASVHIPRAVQVVASMLEAPGRNAMAQLGAARLIFELSAKLQVAASAGAPAKLYVIDSAKAAEELRKRLEGKK